MSWFSKKSPEAPKPTEAAEAKSVERKRPEVRKAPTPEEYAQRAEARKAQSKEKWGNRFKKAWETLKGGVNYAFSVPDRVKTRAGQAKDVAAVAGYEAAQAGKAAVHATAEGARAVGRGVQAGVEVGVGAGVVAAVGTYEAGKYAVRQGKEFGKQAAAWTKEGIQDMGRGIEKGWDSAVNKFNEKRTKITESFRDMRKKFLDSAEMKAYAKEQAKIDEYNKKIKELQDKIGMSEDAQRLITERFQERVAARGVDFRSLGFTESSSEEAAA